MHAINDPGVEAPKGQREGGASALRLSRRDLSKLRRLLSLLHARAARMPVERARQILAVRRRRLDFFSRAIFGEAPWDMLLILYVAGHEGEELTPSRLAQLAGVPATSALRWLDYLEMQGLAQRVVHPTDGRAAIVALSARGRERLEAFLADGLE